MIVRYPVLFVGAGPGDPELITVKGQRALAAADLILYTGSLVPVALLDWAPPGARRLDTSALTLEEIVAQLIAGYEQGLRVVRLHTGDLSLYSAVHEQLQRLRQAGVPFRLIPGVTAAAAAAASLEVEFTLPEITQTVIYTRAAGRTPVPARENLGSLASHQATLVLYLSAHLLEEVQQQLTLHYPPETPVAVVYRASWPEERILRGTLQDIWPRVREAGISKQALILVGPALAPPLAVPASKLYDPAFSHSYRKGKQPG